MSVFANQPTVHSGGNNRGMVGLVVGCAVSVAVVFLSLLSAHVEGFNRRTHLFGLIESQSLFGQKFCICHDYKTNNGVVEKTEIYRKILEKI